MSKLTGIPLDTTDIEQLRTELRFSAAKRFKHYLPDLAVLMGIGSLYFASPGSRPGYLIFSLIAFNYLLVRRHLQTCYSTSRHNPDETLLLIEDLTRHPELIALADALLVDQGDLKNFQYTLLSEAVTRQVLVRDRHRLYAENAA